MFKNFFKATIRKLSAMSGIDMFSLIFWESSGIDTINPNLLVATATDENSIPAAYCTIDPTWIVNGYVFRPGLSDEDAGHAGDAIYSSIEREAKVRGVGKVLLVLPNELPTQPDEKFLRVIELKLPQTVSTISRSEKGVSVARITLPN